MSKYLTRRRLAEFLPDLYDTLDPKDWYVLRDTFVQRPILSGDYDPSTINQAAVRLLTGANRDFSVAGTAATASVLAVGGGVTLTTATSTNDQSILQPRVDINSIAQTQWRTAGFTAAKQLRFRALVSLSNVASVRFMAGLKLTNTPTLATDDDQAMFHFDTAVGTAWRVVDSNAGTDNTQAVGVTVAATTDYLLDIVVKEAIPTYYINRVKVAGGKALKTADATLIPFVGIQTLTTAAKAFTIKHLLVARTH
jgi:hypothetical protein